MNSLRSIAREIFIIAPGFGNLTEKEQSLNEMIDTILDTIENDDKLLKKLREVLGTNNLDFDEKEKTPKKYQYRILLGDDAGKIFSTEEEVKKAVKPLIAVGIKPEQAYKKEEVKADKAEAETTNPADKEAEPATGSDQDANPVSDDAQP